MMTTLMQVMQELGLVGLRIQRMPSEPGLEFGIPSQYSYMTVKSSEIFATKVQLILMEVSFIFLRMVTCLNLYMKESNALRQCKAKFTG